MSRTSHLDAEHLAGLLHSTAIRLLRTVRQVDTSSGLTGPRLSALSVIVFNGPITLGDLAAGEQVKPPTMTRIVNALVEQKLIVKAPDPDDGRSVRIAATIKGKRMLIRGRARRVHLLAAAVQQLDREEQKDLTAALIAMRKLIDRIG